MAQGELRFTVELGFFCPPPPPVRWLLSNNFKVVTLTLRAEDPLQHRTEGDGGGASSQRSTWPPVWSQSDPPPPLSVSNGSASASVTIFPRVDKSQHGDLQLGEQPFGYAEHCSH